MTEPPSERLERVRFDVRDLEIRNVELRPAAGQVPAAALGLDGGVAPRLLARVDAAHALEAAEPRVDRHLELDRQQPVERAPVLLDHRREPAPFAEGDAVLLGDRHALRETRVVLEPERRAPPGRQIGRIGDGAGSERAESVELVERHAGGQQLLRRVAKRQLERVAHAARAGR